MTTNIKPQDDASQNVLAELALAKDVVQLLDARPVSLTITQSLARTRADAVAYIHHAQQHNGNAVSLIGQLSGYLNQHRLISTFSFASLVLFTFLLVQQLDQQSLRNSDAFLLASDLPPEAFADKGFDTWIEAKAQY